METWKPAPSYAPYEVSDLGRVRREGKIKCSRISSCGYPVVCVHGKNRLVHCLVADAFIGPKPHGLQVNHKDLDKQNNHPSNLEYVTASENIRHAFVNGAIKPIPNECLPRGEQTGAAKLTEREVKLIRRLAIPGQSKGWLAKRFSISIQAIYKITESKSWRHV